MPRRNPRRAVRFDIPEKVVPVTPNPLLIKRIQSELQSFDQMSLEDKKRYQIRMIDDKNMKHMRGLVSGPDDSPYSGGCYEIDFLIPDNYPFVAPKTSFVTRIWHPNISSQTGYICLDILSLNWSPAQTLHSILMSLQILMANPVPDDPQDSMVASQLMKNQPLFERTAKYWTAVFAKDNRLTLGSSDSRLNRRAVEFDEFENKLSQLKLDMTDSPEDILIHSLSCNDWDVSNARVSLMNSE